MTNTTLERKRLFISSTRKDLREYRQAAAAVIAKLNEEPDPRVFLENTSMETEVQSGDRELPVAISRRWIEESNWVIVIVGWYYGTISPEPGADGISVTEWEYRTAARDPKKKVFVYVAGDPGSADPYHWSPGELDLKDFRGSEPPDRQEKLTAFREALTQPYVKMFGSLEMFRAKLESDLRSAINKLVPNVQPGTALADLFLAVTPDIRACIRQVNLIANCKRIHDALHELRHEVISRIRDFLLTQWRPGTELTLRQDRFISARFADAQSRLGKIDNMRAEIAGEREGFSRSVDTLLRLPPFWDVEAEIRPSSSEFADNLTDFACAVQEAFHEADRSMDTHEHELARLYEALQEAVGTARRDPDLSPKDHQQLDDEIARLENNTTCLLRALRTHHRWQDAHDKLQYLDEQVESDDFRKCLRRYCFNAGEGLRHLVQPSLPPGGAAQPTDTDAEGAEQMTPFKRLDEALDELRHLASMTTEEARGEYLELRRAFDTAFFWVDKRTLELVERSVERVTAVETLLGTLSAHARGQIQQA